MEKLYTEKEYFEKACQANAEGKKLIKVQEEIEYEAEVLEWDYVDTEETRPKYDEEGNPVTHKEMIENPIYDEEGNIIGYGEPIEVDVQETETVIVKKPVPHMVEETYIDPITGEEKTIIVQGHHTETRTKWVERLEIVDNPENFERCFFETSLGFVKRKAFVKGTGEFKDFLSDMLAGMVVGQPILVYDIELNQTQATVTEEFKQECAAQYNKDFYGG